MEQKLLKFIQSEFQKYEKDETVFIRKCTMLNLAKFMLENQISPSEGVQLIRSLKDKCKVIHSIDSKEFEFELLAAWVLPLNKKTRHLISN